jgi:hypothetical protein
VGAELSASTCAVSLFSRLDGERSMGSKESEEILSAPASAAEPLALAPSTRCFPRGRRLAAGQSLPADEAMRGIQSRPTHSPSSRSSSTDPDDPLALCGRSKTLAMLERYAAAAVDAEGAVRLRPRWHLRRAHAMYKQECFDEALRSCLDCAVAGYSRDPLRLLLLEVCVPSCLPDCALCDRLP